MSRLSKVLYLLGLGVILGGALSLFVPQPVSQDPIEWLETPRKLGNFSLKTETGKFDNQALKGSWHIISFGFLNCVDICPTNLAQLAALAEGAAEQSVAHDIEFVFVSVDPGRDALAAVTQYVQHFSPAITGVTGAEDQLVLFTRGLGIRFSVSREQDDYSVAHSTTFSIIDPEGVFRGRFRPGSNVPQLLVNLTTKLQETSIQDYQPEGTNRLGNQT